MAVRNGLAHQQASVMEDVQRRLQKPLLAFFRRRVHRCAEAEDLVQETFARLARCADLDDVGQIDAYVFRVAANLVSDEIRRAKRQPTSIESSILDAVAEARLSHGLVEEISPERVLIGRNELAHVTRLLMELGERTRTIFVLHRLERMRQRDIGLLLGISVSAVEKHIVRANAHLATYLSRRHDG